MKVEDRNPKIRNPASRLPKEIVRTSILEAKEKSSRIADTAQDEGREETQTEYAGRKVSTAEKWGAVKSSEVALAAGRGAAKKSYEKIRERKREESVAQAAKEAREYQKEAGRTGRETGRKWSAEQVRKQKAIRLKPEKREMFSDSAKRTVKTAPRIVKSSISQSGILEKQLTMHRRQVSYSVGAGRKLSIKSAQKTQTAVQTTKRTAKSTVKSVSAVARATASAVKGVGAVIGAAGAGVLVLLVLVAGVIGGAMLLGNSGSSESVSEEVLAYTPTIQKYANEYGIPEYVAVIQAIMMQESGGRGSDPMQSSECPYNTRFPNSPNAITDPEYSIQVGVRYYAECVREAGCTSPQDMDKLKLSLQGYNYGNGYISWAIRNYGGYSEANARLFSQQQAASHGWSGYGDPEYVPHVLRYYSGGNLFAGLFGNSEIVSVAKSQIGNAGGRKFWSWYGFEGRVEWCACFVSWCADQSGLIQSGAVPRFSLCTEGVNWFQGKGKWQAAGSMPTVGSIIFFDWNGDGKSDHVGIVERCEGGIVYTVEGNSGDAVREQKYAVGSTSILGYGIVSR